MSRDKTRDHHRTGAIDLGFYKYRFRGKTLATPTKRLIPVIPLWPGFAINTLFYAAICWLLWSAPVALRRFIRGRRNRCIKCNYDLRGHEHACCPECGFALASN